MSAFSRDLGSVDFATAVNKSSGFVVSKYCVFTWHKTYYSFNGDEVVTCLWK
jgi:hypothetical protein